MADNDGPLTFDALSTVYRMEKSSNLLSAIRKDFYTAAQELIAAQSKECERLALENPDSIVYEGATQRKKKILVTLRGIVECRMDKIAKMATRGAMGANNVIDGLTTEEKEYYNSILESSKEFWKLSERKKKVFINQDITEIIPKEEIKPIVEPKKPVVDDIPLSEIPVDDTPDEIPPKEIPAEEIIEENIEEPVAPVVEEPPMVTDDISDEGDVVIRILEDLPPFSGPEVNYDLKKEDIVRMPSVMAKALINRGVARLVPTA